MDYPECFKRLVLDDGCPENGHCHDSPNLVGWGNPNAKILLLGKEPAIAMNTDLGRNQYSTEVKSNRLDWCTNIENRTGFDEIFDKHSGEKIYGNPLYPHCWQKSKIGIRKNEAFSKNGGTARTWYQYQKLINMILGRPLDRNRRLDFHKFCFSTDLSEYAGLNNTQIDRKETEKSIDKRRELFRSEFFRNFPVIIAAVGNYRNYLDWEAFGANRCLKEKIDVGNASYMLHVNDDCCNPHLVIAAWQFAAPISDEYLRSIAGKVNDFATEHHIEPIPDSY